MGIITTRVVALVKREAAYGTDPTPVPATDACEIDIPDSVIERMIEIHERPIARPDLSTPAGIVGSKHLGLSFSTEIKGSGTNDTPPGWFEFLLGCYFEETIVASTSVTMALKSKDDQFTAHKGSVTIYIYLDGLVWKISGCRGSVSLDLTPDGGRPLANFSYQGLYIAMDDEALPSPTLDATLPKPVVSSALSFHGESANFVVDQMSIDLANEVTLRKDINEANVVKEIMITGRTPVGTFEPEAVLKATKDWDAAMTAGTLAALDVDIGVGAGEKIHIDADSCQLMSLGTGTREGLRTFPMEFALRKSAGGTDDELVLIHT